MNAIPPMLKRPRLGPPDVYPQEAKQKEDELNSTNVKHGFATMQQLTEEFGTARNCNVTASKVGAYFNAILARKEELMTLPDSGRKKQQINLKDNFWPVIARTKSALDTWFKDLAGTKPLISLAKKAPSFNKKEEIFVMLSENQVSMQRAAWFIKLSSAYTVAVSEAKTKKRQMPDPATEWTATLIKFLKDLVPKLQEFYHQGPLPEKSSSSSGSSSSGNQGSTTSSSSSLNTVPAPLTSPANSGSSSSLLPPPLSQQDEQKLALKQWNYCIQLSKYMYEEGLLDKQEFLTWILDLLDKKPSDDGILKLYLPLTMQYLSDFVRTEKLSRRLAYLVCKKLGHLLNNAIENGQITINNNQPQSSKSENDSDVKEENKNHKISSNKSPVEICFNELLSCPHHRDLVLQLSSIIQVITIECSTALVWCNLGENRPGSIMNGSPLDYLPIAPSALPMPIHYQERNNEMRQQLRLVEETIRSRSKHAEAHWCTDKWQNATKNSSNARILSTLDALDSHCFDKLDAGNSLESLYSKIFPEIPPIVLNSNNSNGNQNESKDIKPEYNPSQDAPIIKILCEWAVSWQRWGEHRAMAVAWLLDKRQNEIISSLEGDSTNNEKSTSHDDKDSVCSGSGQYGQPVLQKVLLDFLDNDAPVLDENGSAQNRAQFKNLVHLFSELIRHDVFSHDSYMCTLIARGDLTTKGISASLPSSSTSNLIPTGPISNTKTSSPNMNMAQSSSIEDDIMADFKPKMEEFDDSNVDDDLDKLLQHINTEQQNSMDAPDSPKDPETSTHVGGRSTAGIGHTGSLEPPVSRHFLYTKHFPLSQESDVASQHDCNQRYILLFGVGKERDEKKHAVKKMSKEICKLFSKKFSIDVADSGKVKKHSRSEFNFESTTNKCQAMSYFDQHFVTWQCAVTVQEMLNSFALGNSNYLPVQEHVAFLFDLMEMALNIYGLIDMCIQILKELPEVEAQLISKNSILVKNYTTNLSLYVVGVLRRYHSCMLLSSTQTSSVFEGLCKVVKHVTNPGDCSSAERCILAYLFDLYSSCSLLKMKPQPSEPFHNAYPKIKQALYAPLSIQPSAHPYNGQFMMDILSNPKRGGKIESGRQLMDSSANRYSFVVNAIIAVIRETDNDRLNDIAATCAELTACCNALSAEWLGALVALCGSKNESYYPDLVDQVDIQNLNIHNSLAVFTCILVARHCFSLENFVVHVALPALVTVCDRDITPEAEAGARLTCHLLLRLFKTLEIPQPGLYTVSTSPNPITSGPACNIKLSCDRHLLAAAHKNIAVAPVLAVLKGILVVGDVTANKGSSSVHSSSGKRSGLNTPVHPGSTPKSVPVELSHILGTSDLGILGGGDEPMLDLSQSHNMMQNEAMSSLSDFAQHVLRQICSQEWVLESCLQTAEALCISGMLIDPMLTPKQAQKLLHMICYSSDVESNLMMDQKSIIVRILENLEQWSIRISWLELQLMYKQTNSSSPELSSWLDTVARAAIDVFQIDNNSNKNEKPKPSIWLVSPLVSKLPSAVQGRILRVAGQVLESTNFFNIRSSKDGNGNGNNGNGSGSGSNSNNSNQSNGNKRKQCQLMHQPFLQLVLTCLKGQDEQKEGLLTSLHTQLSQFLQSAKDLEKVGGIDDPQGREQMLDALQLRFSLVGGMLFDALQKNSTVTTDWAILLAQLISQGVIDLTNNSELFTTVVDILATLIHSTLVSDNQSERDENKKHYNNLMKKLKKELGDKNNTSIRYVRQLLPLSKQNLEVIACDSSSSMTDNKGNKITGFDHIDKKHGHRISDKQRVSYWDLLEGYKNPTPLSWAWFGAVKLERKPLAYEEAHRLLKYHTHSLVKPKSYFYEPLPLPPEDLEPLPEKPKVEDMKADTPSSVDQSPSAVTGSGRSAKGKNPRRPRKQKSVNNSNNVTPNQTPTPQQQQQNIQQPMNPMQQQQQQQQMQGMVGQQQQNPQMGNNPMNAMQMGMQGQNPMQQQQQQFGQGNMMSGQMMNQQQMMGNTGGGPGGMVNNMMNQQPNMGGQQNMNMGMMGGMMAGNQMGGPPQQQPNQQVMQQQYIQQYNPMQQQPQQQQQQQQMMYGQQGMPQQMNRFDQGINRPPNNQSKLALSQMLRQRHPNVGNVAAGGNQMPFNIQQQRQQQQQQQQQQQFIRGPIRGQMPGAMMGGNVNVNQMNTGMPNVVNQPGGKNSAMNAGMIAGNQGQMPNQSQMMAGNAGNQGGMMAQNTGMMPNAGNMMQGPNPNVMQGQQNPGMMNQNAGNMGGMQGMQGNPGNQNNMFGNQQYQNMGQNFGGYGNQGMNQPGNGNANMMGNFNQMNQQQRQTQADYLVQQRAAMANRGQFMQQTPNVTMNNMAGQGAPPYPRQTGVGGGKPAMPNVQSQQFQQQVNQQRIRQQMIMQQQGMAPQNQQGLVGQGGGQGMQQQTPALVAQLQQRQLPNQQGMMGGGYQPPPPPY